MSAARIDGKAELAIVGDRRLQIADRNDDMIEPEGRWRAGGLIHEKLPAFEKCDISLARPGKSR
jgi:hypothetical protein